ncbi:MAG: hypothetical protein FWC39_06860 [Bacteroidetes bacterium]|nr:hypothetical protein [Bacteroidota bacterium]
MKKIVIRTLVVATLLFIQNACTTVNAQQLDNFNVSISQNGEEKNIVNNTVTLQKKEFAIVVHFSQPMTLLVSAALNDKTYKPATKQKPLDELPAFINPGAMAETMFNKDKEILLSDDSPSNWYYDSIDDHRFNSIHIDENGITAEREIENLYDVIKKETIPISDVKKPLYLVFVSCKYNDKKERTEIHRQYMEIKWE